MRWIRSEKQGGPVCPWAMGHRRRLPLPRRVPIHVPSRASPPEQVRPLHHLLCTQGVQPRSVAASGPAPPPPPALTLNSKTVLDPGTFQRKWGQLALSLSQGRSLSPQGAASLMNPQSLIRHMQSNYIRCIASGGQPPNYKFFFYAQKDEVTAFFLAECIVNTVSTKAQLKITADDVTAAEAFSTLFQSALSSFGLFFYHGHFLSWSCSMSAVCYTRNVGE